MPRYLKAWTEALSGDHGALVASAGSGLAHAYFFDEPGTDIGKIAKLSADFRAVAEQYGGSMIIELAPATFKRQLDLWGKPRGDFALMRRIKDTVDPLSVLNPGRFLGGI